MENYEKNKVIKSYQHSFQKYGNTPEAVQFSTEGQLWRFEKLLQICSSKTVDGFTEKSFLEIGCGLGHLYPFLCNFLNYPPNYTGIDIVPEMIDYAQATYQDATFECRDIITCPMEKKFDYVLISGVFNAPPRKDNQGFLIHMITEAFALCRIAVAFNFTSTYVNFTNEGMNYYDPSLVISEIFKNLSKKLTLDHHYRNCDVAVCIYR